jgi:uncharacterized protein (DUF1800 family)
MATLSRRAFLGSLVGAVSLGATGCSRVIDRLAQPDLPDKLNPPGGATRHPIAHLLNRAAFGPRPGQIEQIEKLGRERWIEQQLDDRDIDDEALEWRLRRYDTLEMSPRDLLSFGRDQEYVADELARMTLVRAVFSERQLHEVVVGFWSDHFSIDQFKDEVIYLKTVDDREVIRRHALGKFRDLLRASAHSPAMLHYLDNTENEKSHPNENYAREIMELHTLGVEGGYNEQDVQEVARCLTGWTKDGRGEFTFRSEWHDDREKTVLGHTIPAGGGKSDGDHVLEILADHPSTARYVCIRLVRRFVADDPPGSIVNACVQTWQATDGDIRSILRTLLNHPDFGAAPPKLKRPFELLVSMLRATNANYDGNTDLVRRLDRMGHRPFAWPTPDGYPDRAEVWGGNLLPRWNLADDLANGRLPGVQIDLWKIAEKVGVDRDPNALLRFFGRLFFARDLNPAEEAALWSFALGESGSPPNLKKAEGREQMIKTLGGLLASPDFQWR